MFYILSYCVSKEKKNVLLNLSLERNIHGQVQTQSEVLKYKRSEVVGSMVKEKTFQNGEKKEV